MTCETIAGEVYRGRLVEAEDNMNCQLTEVTATARDGRVTQVENIYIRGSKIRFLILPDMLKNAPTFKNMGKQKGAQNTGATGRGKSAILRAQAARGRGRGDFRGRGRGDFRGGFRGRGGPPPS